MTDGSLNGKKVLITGSSRGIGRALAIGFAQNGADVAIHGVTHSEKMDKTMQLVAAYGTKVVDLYGDLGNPDVASNLIQQTVEKLGTIDILVCNASIQIRRPWMEITDEEMQLQTQTNFYSTVRLMQNAVPHMKENGWGRIVTIGSTQQCKPHPEMLIYAAMKSAIRNVVQNLAIQLAEDHITVNNLSVGTIFTDRNAQVLTNKEYYEKVQNDIPVKRIGMPEDCVGPVIMLCSEYGGYITGEDLHVDGGKFCY